MKQLLLALFVVLALNGFSQNVNIPDVNFKAYLVGNTAINTNLDTEIQLSEATAYTGTIDCSSDNISDLTGIEAFTAINFLFCGNNQLTTLDVSQNIELLWLYCFNNQLTSLDVSQNITLSQLYCLGNQLTSLDVSQNIVLSQLRCDNNQLECLNIKNGNNSNFTNFNASSNPNLICIEVDDVTYSTNNWTDIDGQTSFSSNCDNYCSWGVGINELNNNPKQLLKIVDLMGRVTPYKPNVVLIYMYSDGSTERGFKLEDL